jgi:hypothetical protein
MRYIAPCRLTHGDHALLKGSGVVGYAEKQLDCLSADEAHDAVTTTLLL